MAPMDDAITEKYSDHLVITESLLTGVIFPLLVYVVLLLLTIWSCKSLNRCLIKSLFPDGSAGSRDSVR